MKKAKTRLEILEIDYKRLLVSISNIEDKIKHISDHKNRDDVEITKLLQYKTNAEKLALEKEDEIRYERKRAKLGESDKEFKRKNDNYGIVTASYIKIKND
jgi:uncharacterized protein YqfA (UPF0365 family)